MFSYKSFSALVIALSFSGHYVDTLAMPFHWSQQHDDGQVPLTVPANEITGIGFDLCLSYGVVATAYKNGSYENIARVDAETEYVDIMKRLNLKESQHLHKPYHDFNDQYLDRRRQFIRSGRKFVGLPASTDVGIIARMIASLRKQVEDHVGHGIDAAALTWARDQAVYEEDMLDAMEYVRLESRAYGAKGNMLPWQKEWSSAITVYDIDINNTHAHEITHNRTHDGTHITKGDYWVHRGILAILYTRSALQVSFDGELSFYTGRPFGDDIGDYYYTTDFSLGSDTINNNPNEAYYWDRVRALILERPTRMSDDMMMPITDILLLGESVEGNEQFLAYVKELTGGMQKETAMFLDAQPLYAAARGAARYHAISDGPYPDRTYQ